MAKQKVKDQLRSGKSLLSKGGAFAPLLQKMLSSILEGELEAHIDAEERSTNFRNDLMGKEMKLQDYRWIFIKGLNFYPLRDATVPSTQYFI